MRKKIVAGNWKMNKHYAEAVELFREVDGKAAHPASLESILIFPPFPYIESLCKLRRHPAVSVGAQNVSSESAGAYTGEVSAGMLRSVGASHVLIGHSERRNIFNEGKSVLKQKLDRCLENSLNPVLCCGEQLKERQSGSHFQVVEDQISSALYHLDGPALDKVIIAYEPVWAIGTGVTATSGQAQEMHAFIRQLIGHRFGTKAAGKMFILYGGSCNASNAAELFACPDIDGGLIGGASLQAEEFLRIISVLHD